MKFEALSTAIIILNYNNTTDTIACAESVLASTVAPKWVFIVDNASTDGSMEKLLAWAEQSNIAFALNPQVSPQEMQLVFLQSESNRGYAAGNNLGISLAVQWGADAVWILNNDTEVEKEAHGAMLERLFSKQRPGLCGSLILYTDTGLVQCCAGAKTNLWTGLSTFCGHNLTREQALQLSTHEVEQYVTYIDGASVMASREFIRTVGLMDERYFLYCEEQDWAYAAKNRFDFAYAPKAIVHHKEGSTTGFSKKKFAIKPLLRLTRSRILVTLKFRAWALPTVILSIVFAATRMLMRRMIRLLKNTIQ